MPSSRKPESPVICARRPKARVPDAMPVKAGQSANRALAAPLFHPPEVAKPRSLTFGQSRSRCRLPIWVLYEKRSEGMIKQNGDGLH